MLAKFVIIGAASLGSLLSTDTWAQTAPASSAASIVSSDDNDKDNTLDLAEVKAAASAHFDKLNQDGDATLETNEVKGVIGAKLFKAADTDHDGTLSKDEYLALVEKLFQRADVDHDGTLNVTELKSKSAHRLRKLIS